MTVRHLHTLRRQNVLGTRSENSYAEKFKAGFRHCAAEVSSFLNVVDHETSSQILKHLNSCMNHMERTTTTSNTAPQFHHQYQANRVQGLNNRPAIQIQSPNQINAHVVASHIPNVNVHSTWSAKSRSPAPIVSQQQYCDVRMRPTNNPSSMHFNNVNRSTNSTPENLNESSTRINTPPLSPKVDIDDSLVWRPW